MQRHLILALSLLCLPLSGWTQGDLTSAVVAESQTWCQCHPIYSEWKEGQGQKEPQPRSLSFHQAHLALEQGSLDSAFQYAKAAGVALDQAEGQYYCVLMEARVLVGKGLYEEATTRYQEALTLADETSFPLQGDVVLSLGNLQLVQGHFTEALQLYQSRDWTVEANRAPDFTKFLYHNVGLCHLRLQHHDSAEFYLKESLAIELAQADTVGLAISYLDVGNLYYEQYQDEKALTYFQQGLAFALETDDSAVIRNAYHNMAVVEEERGNIESAFEYHKQYEAIRDSLWNRDRVWALAEMEKSFELDLKESEVQRLDAVRLAQEASLTTRSWQRNSLLLAAVVLLLLLVGSGWAYFLLRKKNRLIDAQKSELADLNQAKSHLFSIVAHDLRSPVLALKRSQSSLEQAFDQNNLKEVQTLFRANALATNQTYELLNNLLHWSMAQSDQMLFRPEPCMASEIIHQVSVDFQHIATAKNITLSHQIEKDGPVAVDLNSMKITMRNLVDNAIKFTPNGGRVTLAVSANEKEVRWLVQDTGVGIKPVLLAHLFDVSREKVREDCDGHSGTGLGLVLCQTMVEKNGGTLKVESTEQIGTTFSIHVPTLKESIHEEG